MNALHAVQVAKRAVKAEGFLELGLPKLALASLADIEPTPDVAAWVNCLRCLAEIAEEGVPLATDPYRRKFAREMTDCYLRAGWRPKTSQVTKAVSRR